MMRFRINIWWLQAIPLFLISVWTISAKGQINFVDKSDLLNDNFYSHYCKAITDIDGDGLDDIIRSFPNVMNPDLRSDVGVLEVLYQQEDGSFITDSIGQSSRVPQLSIAVADLDGDGDKDILTGGFYDGLNIYENQDGDFTIRKLTDPRVAMQGCQFVDINQDKFLDFFACHDEGTSQIWLNDQAGNLTPHSELIDFNTEIPSDNSGNYGSQWTDFDDDGDLDLYIAKCSIYAMDNPDDPRRINVLYVNDGNGGFTEEAEEWGLQSKAQSWTPTFFDMDNDGDLDCYITNHAGPSELYENINNNYFWNVTIIAGVGDAGNPIQCVAEDFDNDMYLDLLISGDTTLLFRNNGNGQFTNIIQPIDSKPMRSFSTGDLNRDGFVDIYASFYLFEQEEDISYDRLLFNVPNDHNYLSISLEGTISNRDGIGAKIKAYLANQVMVREIQGGQSYGITRSYVQNFGMARHAQLDSLKVYWPSGIINTYYNVQANQELNLIETPILNNTEVATDVNIEVFPNPTNDFAFISGIQNQDLLTICSSNGILVKKQRFTNGNTKVDLRYLLPGIYTLNVIRDGRMIHMENIIIEK